MVNRIADISLRKAALIAGLGYVVIFISATIGGIFANGPGDIPISASKLLASESLYGIGIAGWLIDFIADVVVAWALYVLFKPVSKSLSLLAAWFRLIFVGIAATNLLNLLIPLQLSRGADYLSVFEPGQVQALMLLFLNAFNDGILISFIFFGLHIFIIGYLIFKSSSSYIPRIIGVLLIVAAVGYQINSFANYLLPNIANYEATLFGIAIAPAIISEFLLMLWLLLKGGKIPEQKNVV